MVKAPRLAGKYVRVYQPAGDVFSGPDEGELKAGRYYPEWVPNDHCFIKGDDGCWHVFGITHPRTRLDRVHEGENQSFHAIAPRGELREVLRENAWADLPKVLPPAERPGETRAHHAPFIVKRDGLYHMLYGPAPLRRATTPDLRRWTPRGELAGAPAGRDPSVLVWNDVYHLLVCGRREVRMAVSRDLVHWEDDRPILRMKAGVDPESPCLIRHDNTFYLFVCGWDGAWDQRDLSGAYQHATYVYASDDLARFTSRCELPAIRAHAPEVFRGEDGGWYVSSAEWPCRGVSIAPLVWE